VNSRNLLLAMAVISVVMAVFMMFFPITFLNWFLKTAIPAQFPPEMAAVEDMVDLAKLGFAFFGAMLAGIGVVCFFASNATASVLRKNVIMGMAFGTVIGFVLCLIAQLSGKFTGLGWILVAIWALLAILQAYFSFVRTED
jgi:hypothetical protein